MPRPTKSRRATKPTTVLLIEHDSWSGTKIIGRKVYRCRSSARHYCAKVNSKNTATQVPDYYLTAEILGEGLYR